MGKKRGEIRKNTTSYVEPFAASEDEEEDAEGDDGCVQVHSSSTDRTYRVERRDFEKLERISEAGFLESLSSKVPWVGTATDSAGVTRQMRMCSWASCYWRKVVMRENTAVNCSFFTCPGLHLQSLKTRVRRRRVWNTRRMEWESGRSARDREAACDKEAARDTKSAYQT